LISRTKPFDLLHQALDFFGFLAQGFTIAIQSGTAGGNIGRLGR
jgi:hypothetical protein